MPSEKLGALARLGMGYLKSFTSALTHLGAEGTRERPQHNNVKNPHRDETGEKGVFLSLPGFMSVLTLSRQALYHSNCPLNTNSVSVSLQGDMSLRM